MRIVAEPGWPRSRVGLRASVPPWFNPPFRPRIRRLEQGVDRLNVSILAAGAGGMYCGSCMRDNALAGALKRLGHDVTLIPLYTPLRTDAPGTADGSEPEVFYGGVNVYLQHASRLFRHTPRVLDWVFDRPWLLNTAGEVGGPKPPGQ